LKNWFFGLIFLAGLAAYALNPLAFSQDGGTGEEELVRALESSGAAFQEYRVLAWSVMRDRQLADSEVEGMAHRVASILGMEQPTLTRHREPDFLGLMLGGPVGSHGWLVVAVQAVAAHPGTASTQPETYLLVSLAGRDQPDGLHQWRQEISAVFEQLSLKPRLSLTVTGTFPGRLDSGQRRQVTKQTFRYLQAKYLEGMEEGDLSSATGYTRLIGNHLTVAGRKVNVNTAVRYHSVDDRTYLSIATPLLDGEY